MYVALAITACPPLELFEASRDWLHVGREFRRVYGDVIRFVPPIILVTLQPILPVIPIITLTPTPGS